MSLLCRAMKLGCQNKDYPDKYGHYREAKYCQTKNHWFWKVEFSSLFLWLLFLRAGVQPTLDPYAEAFFVSGPLR